MFLSNFTFSVEYILSAYSLYMRLYPLNNQLWHTCLDKRILEKNHGTNVLYNNRTCENPRNYVVLRQVTQNR